METKEATTNCLNESCKLRDQIYSKVINEIVQVLICPISKEMLSDPVVGSDEITYENECIKQWIIQNNHSPLTKKNMDVDLRKNRVAKQITKIITTNLKEYKDIQFVSAQKKEYYSNKNKIIKSLQKEDEHSKLLCYFMYDIVDIKTYPKNILQILINLNITILSHILENSINKRCDNAFWLPFLKVKKDIAVNELFYKHNLISTVMIDSLHICNVELIENIILTGKNTDELLNYYSYEQSEFYKVIISGYTFKTKLNRRYLCVAKIATFSANIILHIINNIGVEANEFYKQIILECVETKNDILLSLLIDELGIIYFENFYLPFYLHKQKMYDSLKKYRRHEKIINPLKNVTL